MALLLPNSVDFVVAALACLSVGAIFVPLAVTDPPSRLDVIIGNCAPTVVVTTSDDEGARPALGHHLRTSPRGHHLGVVEGGGAAGSESGPPGTAGAYAIYTSGTTGTPKGVLIGRAAFAAAVGATADALGLDRTTRTLCVSPFHFDGSFGTLFPTLSCGGAVVIRPREALLFPRTFFKAVASEDITYTGFSPSYLRLLLASALMETLAESHLHVVALGGEASSPADIRALWAAAPDLEVFNRYGPTETTIAVTHVKVTPADLAAGTVPIGQPHPGVTFHLVDDEGRVVETPDQVGELYIGGHPADDRLLGSSRADRRRDADRRGPRRDAVPHRRPRVPQRIGRLRLRGPGRPGDQAERGTDLADRDERRPAPPGRGVRRRLRGLRRRRAARHRRLRRDRWVCDGARTTAGRQPPSPRLDAAQPDRAGRSAPSDAG